MSFLISSVIAIYSASTVDKATINYKIEHQLIDAWNNVKAYTIADQRLSRSLA